jgi:hypothetical protein
LLLKAFILLEIAVIIRFSDYLHNITLMKHLFFITLFIVYSFTGFSQALPIGIDEDFSDWTNEAISYTDESGDASGTDFLSFSVSNDAQNLYIRLKIADETLLNNDNNIFLQIDTDNNSETGYQAAGIGAELGWVFAERYGYYNPPSAAKITLEHSDISFIALPTVSSKEFEMAISRDAVINGYELFPGNTIKLVFYDDRTDGDFMPDLGATFTYTFDDESQLPETDLLNFERKSTEDIRIMTFNILFDGLIDSERQAGIERTIQAVKPDIVTFNEAWDTQAYQAQSLMNEWVPLSEGSWECIEADDGNITCSSFPIADTYRIMPGHRLTAALIDLPESYGTDLLSVNAHLKCCGGSSNNAERQLEADAFAAFILDAKSAGGSFTLPENTPIVLSGDLNLVGDRQQLTTMLTGDIQNVGTYGEGGMLDWDGTALTDLLSTHTDGRHAYTWYDESSSFWPGRLDYIIYSDAVMEHTHAFTVNTRLMTPERLSQYGLQSQDSESSDHLAKVADFSFGDFSGSASLDAEETVFIVVPDSAGSGNYLVKSLKNENIRRLTVYDAGGRRVLSKAIHNTFYYLNLQGMPSGFYIIKAEGNENTATLKLMHQN